MPRGDATGPMGMGSLSGRGAGYCAGYAAPGFANPTPGWGAGRGRGRGYGMGMARRRGWGAWGYPVNAYPQPAAPAVESRDEVEVLKSQAEYFGEALEGINRRIAEIEAGTK